MPKTESTVCNQAIALTFLTCECFHTYMQADTTNLVHKSCLHKYDLTNSVAVHMNFFVGFAAGSTKHHYNTHSNLLFLSIWMPSYVGQQLHFCSLRSRDQTYERLRLLCLGLQMKLNLKLKCFPNHCIFCIRHFFYCKSECFNKKCTSLMLLKALSSPRIFFLPNSFLIPCSYLQPALFTMRSISVQVYDWTGVCCI